MKNKIAAILFSFVAPVAQAVEQQVHGMIDIQYAITDGIDSYLTGDYGKFRYNDGSQLNLGQAAIRYRLDWENQLSFLVITNAYADGVKDNIGITESFLQYRGLPSENGYRSNLRGGLMYPKVSMTNVQTGWSSPYTISYSMINAWLATELRHQGLEYSITRLGRFSGSAYDFEISATAFQANDTAGAVLAWYGWSSSNRQTLRQENQALPNSFIGFVPENSNVFVELDHRTGFHINTKWTWQARGKLLAGYYDNRGDPRVEENGQWAWTTRFIHLGVKWNLTEDLELNAQYLAGDTLMQNTSGTTDLVNNDYNSVYLMLSKKWDQHRTSARIENFSVTDNDNIAIDNNDENGKAFTINHTFRFDRQYFLYSEYNWVDSDRRSRTGPGHPQRLIERQMQFGVRYFF